jgi:hypothetical protein
MSEIGTHKQVVNAERFSKGYDATYHCRKPEKPGKTVYVGRNGKLLPKSETEGFAYIEALVFKAGEIDRNLRWYEEMVVRGLQIPERQLALQHINQPCSMSAKG